MASPTFRDAGAPACSIDSDSDSAAAAAAPAEDVMPTGGGVAARVPVCMAAAGVGAGVTGRCPVAVLL